MGHYLRKRVPLDRCQSLSYKLVFELTKEVQPRCICLISSGRPRLLSNDLSPLIRGLTLLGATKQFAIFKTLE